MEVQAKIAFIIQLLKAREYHEAEREIASLVLDVLKPREAGSSTQTEVFNRLKPLYDQCLELDFELKLHEHFSDWVWDVFMELDVYEHYGPHGHEVSAQPDTCRQCMDIAAMKKLAENALRQTQDAG